MNTKKIIAAILCVGLFAGMAFGTISYVKAEGDATGNVINNSPTLNVQEIRDGGYVVSNTITPLATNYLNVSIYDADGIVDILNTTVTLRYMAFLETDNPSNTYRFCYNETQALDYQVYPTSGTYLQNVVRTTFGANTLNYSFEIVLNGTAVDSNSVLTKWTYALEVEDIGADPNVTQTVNFYMAPYIGINYWGNAGNMDFSWTGEPESNNTVSFNTLVTANDNYNLNASYYGDFQAPWGAPNMWIKYDGDSPIQIANLTATPAADTVWYYGTGGFRYEQNLTHYIALDFPAGIVKDTPYIGVTIWIEATNV